MTAANKITGAGCVLSVNGIDVAIVDATFNVKRGIASQSRVGKYSKYQQPGDLDISGSFTLQNVSGNHLGLLLNSGANVAAVTKTVLNNMDTVGDWTSSDGVNTVLSQETSTIKEGTGALKITCTAVNSANDTVTDTIGSTDLSAAHYIGFWIRSTIAGQVITFGFGESLFTEQTHAVTIQAADTWQYEIFDISAIAAASRNAVTKTGFTINSASNPVILIDDLNAFAGVKVGVGSVIGIIGTGTDALGNYVTITAPACILTSGTIKFGDPNTIVDGPMDFMVQDADDDILTYT